MCEADLTDILYALRLGFLSNYLSEEETEGEVEVEEIDGDEEDEEDDNIDDSTSTLLESCLASIFDTLSQHNPM